MQARRGDGKNGEALLVDKKGMLVCPGRRAAILDNPQTARGDLLLDAVVEQDDPVSHVLFETIPRQLAFAALASDDRGNSFFFQPAEQAAQFGANDRFTRQRGEERFESVEHDAFRADLIDGIAETKKQSFEILLAGAFAL